MRLLASYAAALALLLPVALVMMLTGLVCLALRVVLAPFDRLYARCREFFLFVESAARARP